MADPSLLAYVAERTGMRQAGAQQRRLSQVVTRACEETGLSPASYGELLRHEQPAFDALVDALTIGETYFFRERPQLELLREAVEAERMPARPLRAWSAGCSTGEEAYTLAILLAAAAAPHGVQVVGSDLSPRALARAERATYGERALRGLADGERSRWFTPIGRGQVRVRNGVRHAVRFSPGNLLDGPPQHQSFDVVLCRNVLIYLSREAIARVAEGLRDALLPSGWLLTGVADPVLEVDGLERVATSAGLLYRREGGSVRSASLGRSPRPPDEGTPHRLSRRAAATHSVQRRPPSSRAPEPPPAPLPAPLPAPPVRVAATPSAPPASVEAALSAVDAAPVDASQRYRLAVLHLQSGDLRSAAEAATAAAFLDSDLVVAHLLLGRIHEARQDHRAARRCFSTAASLLDQLPGHAPVPHADGETAEALARVVGTSLGRPTRTRKDKT